MTEMRVISLTQPWASAMEMTVLTGAGFQYHLWDEDRAILLERLRMLKAKG